MKRTLWVTTATLAIALASGPALADMDAAKKFLDNEIKDLSSLSRADQEKEMQWFIFPFCSEMSTDLESSILTKFARPRTYLIRMVMMLLS